MNLLRSQRWLRLSFLRPPDWLAKVAPDAAQEAARIRAVERDLGLLVKASFLAILYYYLFLSLWFEDVVLLREGILEVVRLFYLIYLVLNILGGVLLATMDDLPFALTRETVLVLCMLDALFVGALTAVTGGFDSFLFWIFLALIVRNSFSLPQAGRQILLNLFVAVCYVAAGLTENIIVQMEFEMLDPKTWQAIFPSGIENPTEPVLLRVFLLLLMTACCYGVEVLFDKQRRVEEEGREAAQRQQQLESAGRLAAEIAHQLKNPLGIINNAAFTLQRTVKEGKTITQQIQIIREEVERSDRIITELMGYARLVEGRVERLDVAEELEAALRQVFPDGVSFNVRIQRDYARALPPLMVQRSHLSLIFVNLLQNAREAMNGHGTLALTAHPGDPFTVVVTIADTGPGIPPEEMDKIFEAHYSTKEKGSGLGLAIVRHNTELYGGKVKVESELGKGTKFTLDFPARIAVRLRK
jgi:signal transduction histidine kinase